MFAIKNVGIVGSGTMGRQIALNSAINGFTVALADQSPDALAMAKKWCNDYLVKSVEKGRIKQTEANAALSHICWTQSVEQAVKDVDLVVEAIIEKPEIKKELFTNLNKWAPKDALLTSNSSYIPSSSYKDVVDNPSRLANLHYFNPAMRMELVEIVRGEHTANDTVAALKEFVTANKKICILVNKEIEGFVVNRLLRAMQDEGYYLLENGVASFSDIDLGAEKGLNWPMGPFRLMDLTGLDLNYYNRQKKYEQTGLVEDRPPQELVKRFEKGEYGRKSGKGWYNYLK